ncbi:hypothetical protein BD289DRAFT_257124 [Coniella lustricola]|uniref:Uncharacterized protein n=1 Tax=Coniella lustricola TaxID=2025994 RepID=A0A2T3AL48_9PEZI|nr:hypothetical protein BD289DRAFT_257124 [Coniella lustricola]
MLPERSRPLLWLLGPGLQAVCEPGPPRRRPTARPSLGHCGAGPEWARRMVTWCHEAPRPRGPNKPLEPVDLNWSG